MTIKGYGVWKGTPTSWDGHASADHGHMSISDGSAKAIDVAVNVESKSSDARLVYWLLRDFDKSHPIAQKLASLQKGFYKQDSHSSSGLGLDFLRGNFLDVKDGVLVSHDAKGETHDILDYLDPILNQAVSDKADIYLFGQRYDDSDGTSGIHDIHMNQGNSGSWKNDNGVYQDGGIIIRFSDGHWEGLFLAFAVQSYQTDDSGNPIGPTFAELLAGSTAPAPDSATPSDSDAIMIQAALVNPLGRTDQPTGNGRESVFLLNRSSKAVSLDGWSLMNQDGAGEIQKLPAGATLGANSRKGFLVPDIPLSNQGGCLVLYDGNGTGVPVDRAEWTETLARREGGLVYFKQRK